MPEYHKTDGMLLNWIRAREGNLVKAEEMIRKVNTNSSCVLVFRLVNVKTHYPFYRLPNGEKNIIFMIYTNGNLLRKLNRNYLMKYQELQGKVFQVIKKICLKTFVE